jgi:hypothetical protein
MKDSDVINISAETRCALDDPQGTTTVVVFSYISIRQSIILDNIVV